MIAKRSWDGTAVLLTCCLLKPVDPWPCAVPVQTPSVAGAGFPWPGRGLL